MKIIGLMSGTSADGVDVALCEVEGAPPRLQARILHAATFPYDETMRARILACCQIETSNVQAICTLNVDLAKTFVQAIFALLDAADVLPSEVDLIASHGQTIWHNVDSQGQVTATLQIGEASLITEWTGITTLHNFRARDVAAGGQGAPLMGCVDWLLLRHETRWRAIQNIGGMSNVTLLAPLSRADVQPLAFDTGPGTALLDAAVAFMTEGALHYDEGGAWAAEGQIDQDWLAELLKHPYYAQQPPKTTGRETFGVALAVRLVMQGRERSLSDTNILATLTALTAASIADAYRRFAPAPIDEIIIGGGGAHNATLLGLLEQYSGGRVLRHEDIGLYSDYKEALVFAVLGYESWHNRPASLPSLTGADQPSVLGQITPGANYTALLHKTHLA